MTNTNARLKVEFKRIVDAIVADFQVTARKILVKAIEQAKPLVEGKTYSDTFGSKQSAPYGAYSRASHQLFLRGCFEADTGDRICGRINDPFKIKDDETLEKIIQKEVDYWTSMLYDGFVAKNTAKIEGILKGDDDISVESTVGGNLVGHIRVRTSTGGSFVMQFSIVHAFSNKGTYFQRFPTTFHNVTLSDGTEMKKPSEAKMKREFK